MAGLICVLPEDQLLCSICKRIFTDPVTTPCGHSFCQTCIYRHWDDSDRCQCPVCKEDFRPIPQLKISTCLSEMALKIKEKPWYEDMPEKLEKLIEERRDKIQEINRSVELSWRKAKIEMEKEDKFYRDFIECVQQSQKTNKQHIQKMHKETERKADDLIGEIEGEILELKKGKEKIKNLTKSTVDFLNTFPFKPDPYYIPLVNNWTDVTVNAPSYEGRVDENLSEVLTEMKNVYPELTVNV